MRIKMILYMVNSNTLFIDIQAVPPDPPRNVQLGVIAPTSISLKWGRPDGMVESYIVEYGINNTWPTDMRELTLQVGNNEITRFTIYFLYNERE